jgi:hypothetical protein
MFFTKRAIDLAIYGGGREYYKYIYTLNAKIKNTKEPGTKGAVV